MIQSRTHNCNELRLSDAGGEVTLCGWFENLRKVSKNLGFLVLRDYYGVTQIVIENEEMMDKLKLAAIVTHVADSRTSILHPASHTHRQMNDEQLKEAGVAPDLIRLSVGIENVNDIIADLEQAL